MAIEKKNFPERKRKGKLRGVVDPEGGAQEKTAESNLLGDTPASTAAPNQSVEDLIGLGSSPAQPAPQT